MAKRKKKRKKRKKKKRSSYRVKPKRAAAIAKSQRRIFNGRRPKVGV